MWLLINRLWRTLNNIYCKQKKGSVSIVSLLSWSWGLQKQTINPKIFFRFKGSWKFQTRDKMDFGILILVLIALVDFLVFLSFLALLTYFRFCASINFKNEQTPVLGNTVYQVEEVEGNISNSLHHLNNLISNTSFSRPIQRSSSSNSSSSSR